jgi:exopolysaccharide biosynthesis WecB/TagA/CpsF family protein
MGFINDESEVKKTLMAIENSQANYVFLAVGSPRQEILAKKIKDQNLVNGVVLCIGASILFIVGEEKRAPMLIQAMHLEWLYRAMQDPKRLLSRYIDNIIRLPKLYKSI